MKTSYRCLSICLGVLGSLDFRPSFGYNDAENTYYKQLKMDFRFAEFFYFVMDLQAHVMLHVLRESKGTLTSSNIEAAVAESSKRTHVLYDDFKQQASSKVLQLLIIFWN